MASSTKVNTKFALILSAVILALVAGAGALVVYSQLKAAERNFAEAQRLMQEGETLLDQGQEAEAYSTFNEAQKQFGIAVRKQQTNIEYVEAFRDALLRTRPDASSRYQEYYFNDYYNAVNTLASLQFDDAQAQLDFVELLDERIRVASDRAGWGDAFTSLIATVSDRLERLPDESDPAYAMLRGYRGKAQVERMLRTRVDEADRELALEDLRAALEANPERDDFAAAIVRWYVGEYQTLRASRPSLAAEALETGVEEANRFAERYENSPEVLAMAASLRLTAIGRMDQQERSALVQQFQEDRAEIIDLLMQMPADELDIPTLQSVESIVLNGAAGVRPIARRLTGEKSDSPYHLFYAALMHRSVDDFDSATAAYQQIVDMPLPELSLEGVILPNMRVQAALGQADLALTRFRRTADAEARDELLDAAKSYRATAAELAGVQARNELKLVDAQIALIEGRTREAQRLFSELRTDRGDRPEILVGLARSAAALGNLDEAQDLYERVLASPAGGLGVSEREYRAELANVYARKGENERALELIQRLREEVGEGNEALAREERRLRQFMVEQIRIDRAELQQQLAQAEPGGAEARRLEIAIRAEDQRLERYGEGLEIDPIARALSDASILFGQGERENAVELLERAYEQFPDDQRLVLALIRGYSSIDRRADAADLAEVARQQFPETEIFRRMQIALSNEDPYEATIAVIEGSPELSELDKAVQKTQAAESQGRTDDADRFYEQARSIDPDDPRVIEFGFNRAVNAENYEAARAMLNRVRETNADQVEGVFFEGRLELAQNRFAEAAELFRRATERIPSEPTYWRFLGLALSGMGQVDQAIAAFDRALSIRGDDLNTARDYARTLESAGRPDEALAVIGPDSGVFGAVRSNPQIREIWLRLEARVGNTDRAIRERAERFEANPADGANTAAYLNLLVDAGRTERAREAMQIVAQDQEALTALGSAVGLPPRVAVTAIEARTLSAAGDPAAGAQLWDRRLPELQRTTLGSDAALQYARYLLSLSDENGTFEARAFAVLDAARDQQSDSAREVDRAVAQAALDRAARVMRAIPIAEQTGASDRAARLQSMADSYNERAVEGIRRVLQATDLEEADERNLRLGLARTLVRLERLDQADEELARLLDEEPESLEGLLLKAEIEQRRDDLSSARRTLNRVIELHPDSYRPFLARALVNRGEEALFADVIADLDRVHELNPSLIDAWRARFGLYAVRGDLDQAFADLRQAIADFPGAAEPLRQILVGQLAVTGRELEAATQAARYADEQPDNMYWQARAGELAIDNGQYRAATRMLERLYESPQLDARPTQRREAAALLLDARMRAGADLVPGETLRLLELVKETPGAETNIPVLMLEARAQNELGEAREAIRLATEAFGVAREDGSLALDRWWTQMGLMLDSPADRRTFVRRLTSEAGEPPIIIAMRLVQDDLRPDSLDDAYAERVRAVYDRAREAGDALATLETARFLSTIYYNLERYEDTLEVARQGLEANSEDPVLNNAAAFVLVRHLDQPEAALPYAETAYAFSQDDPGVLDTAALVWLENDRSAQALATLERARSLTDAPDLLAPINIHLAMARLAEGDRLGAGDALRDAERAIERAAQRTRDQYEADIQRLREQIGG